MIRNMSTRARGTRAFLLAPVAIVGALICGVNAVGAILVSVAAVLFATAATGFCPTYGVVGWRVRLIAAKFTGRAFAWLMTGGRLALLSLTATAAAVLFLPITYWQALLGFSIALLLVGAMRAKVRVVIEGFDDYRGLTATSQEESGADAAASDATNSETRKGKDAGTAVLLANRLAEMRELYGFVDDPDSTPTPDRPAGATIQLDDAASVLRAAVTTESTVSVGPISIPLGAAMGLLGRLVQAPRLRGAIHGDERRIIVTAELVMNGQPYAWRVAKDIEDETSARRALEAMINDELAYQVFSDLTLQRQARWPATKFWLDALRNVAECQRRPRNRRLLLTNAEWNFMRALSEDQRFYLACLNLGVVYQRLAQTPRQPAERSRRYMLAATRVFEHAVRLRPDRWEAYHALAEAHWRTHALTEADAASGSIAALEMTAGLCERALSRNADRTASARILDLKGQAEANAAVAIGNPLATQRRACWLAMSELGWTRLRFASARQASRLKALENLAAQCQLNLAWTAWNVHAHGSKRGTRRDRRAFKAAWRRARLAIGLSDVDATAHARLAELAEDTGQLHIALQELSAAARIAPADPLYAAHLALVFAKNKQRGRACEACARAEHLIDFGDPDQKQAQDLLIEAYRVRGEPIDLKRAEALETRKTLADELESCNRGTRDETIAALKELLESLGEKRDWEAARVRAQLGMMIRDGAEEPEQRSREAEQYFLAALEWFATHQPDDNRLADLHSDRAQALALRQACSGEALAEAETAVLLSPLRAARRDVLAHVYEAGGDLNSACSAAKYALLLEPDDPMLHHRLAMLKWKLAESLANPAAHATERQWAAAEFEEALKLYASDQRDGRRTTSWWLAMSYFAMSQFEEVPAHLRFVLTSIASSAESPSDGWVAARGLEATARLWLAMTYRKLGKYLEAQEHAREAVGAAKELDDNGVQLTRGLADVVEDDRWPLWVVLALSHMQVAGCHSDRDGKLSEAAGSLNEARRVFERMDAQSDINPRETETYADLETERGRLLLAEDKANDAITALRMSADIDPDEADVYLLLARAHARAAEQLIEPDWEAHIRHARAACRRTRMIGGEQHPDAKEAAEVEKQLDRVEAVATERSVAAEGNGHSRADGLVGTASSS